MKGDGPQTWSAVFLFAPIALLVVFMMTAVASLFGQTATTGDIAGVVTDPSAAVVTGVPMTLKNVDTGSSTSTTTNAQGSYNFSLLPPGNYLVVVNAVGFQKVTKPVTVTLGTSTTVNLQLALSSQNETVEVTDEVTGVQTEDANL